ncbi:glutathione S-transferase N-terminal domain-containing protein [Sphingomonas sp. 1P06PA]|uniref:glutathione S-transferase N-terminal domain-containing protein n=1 Tax=Sphingomonas sp. 1P06PA TaxID=554121 RepID=UPI0039A69160
MPFTLINARPSPFGRKVAIALLEKGLDYVVRYDVPWGGNTCTPDYSPVEQLPILVADDGERIYDSPFILEWLETRYPEPPLLPGDPDARLAARKRQMLGERLMEFAQSLIFELHRPDPSEPWVDRQTRKVFGALAELDRLYESRGAPDIIDLGDIAVGTTLLILEFVVPAGLSPDIDAIRWRRRYPALTRFGEIIERRPSFAATAPAEMDVDLQAAVA